MRSLLTLVVLALTCAPAATPEPIQPIETRSASPRSPTWHASVPAASSLPTTQLVVHLPGHDPADPWTTRGRDAWQLDDIGELLMPPAEDWPNDELSQALHHALCGDVESCDDLDDELAWEEVADLIADRGLDEAPPGTEGDPWERYATLWLAYAQSSGFFLEDEERAELVDGLEATLETVADGPLRAPLLTAWLLVGWETEELVADKVWELVEDHDERYAIVAMEALLEGDVTPAAFDELDFAPDGTLELHRRRVALEQAAVEGRPVDDAAAALLHHPLADDGDRLDVEELHAQRNATAPQEPWARALVADAEACADLTAGDRVRLQVRDGAWRTHGASTVADCLYGWSWPEPVADQDVVLSVVR